MRLTIKESVSNKRNLSIIFRSYGHWDISCDYRGKRIKCVTTNSEAIDNFKSDEFEKANGRNRRKQGYEDLVNEIIRKNTDKW